VAIEEVNEDRLDFISSPLVAFAIDISRKYQAVRMHRDGTRKANPALHRPGALSLLL
jgi:hypothetical protein